MRVATWAAAIALASLAGGARADSYAVEFQPSRNPENNGQYRVAQVVARLTPIDGQVGVFRNGEDTGLTHGWATFIHDAHAFGADGRELPMAYQGAGRWRLAGSWFDVRRRLVIDESIDQPTTRRE